MSQDAAKPCSRAPKNVRKSGLSHIHVDPQQRIIIAGIKIIWIDRHHFAPEQPAKTTGIQITALEWLFTEMLPERFHESGIRPLVCWTAIGIAFAPRDRSNPLGVRASDHELELGA